MDGINVPVYLAIKRARNVKDIQKTKEHPVGELKEPHQQPVLKRVVEQLEKHCNHLEKLLEESAVQLNRETAKRKQAEKALKESEERYHSLFNNSINGFALHEIVTDAEGWLVGDPAISQEAVLSQG